jgi:O-antigen/teichoic acid export membrane protein
VVLNQRKAGVLLSYILTGTNALVGFIYIPLLIFYLGKEEYGLYQLMGSFLVYLSLFDFGLSNTVTRYYSKYIALKDEEGKENLLALSTIIYLLLTLILVVCGGILYFYLESIFANSLTSSEIEVAKKMYIVILINVAIIISTSVFNSVIISYERFVFFKGLTIVQAILLPVIVIAIFSIEASAFILILIQTGINILGVVLKIYYSYKKINVKIKLHYLDTSLLKEMVRYSFFIFITALMDQIFWRSDQIVLGSIVGTASVASYSIGSQILMYYMTLSTAMSGVFLPNITKKVAENVSNEELSNIFIKIGRLQYLLLGAVLVGFILFGKEFITIWVGEDFVQSYYITLLIIIPFTIDLIQNIGLTILQAKNMYSFRAIVFFIMSILKVGISIPLAFKYGGIGAAAATGFSYSIGNGIVMNIYYYKKVGLNIFSFWKEIFKLSISFAIIFGFGILIDHIHLDSQILSLLVKLSIYSVIYLLIIWKLGMNEYEKQLASFPMKRILTRKKNLS